MCFFVNDSRTMLGDEGVMRFSQCFDGMHSLTAVFIDLSFNKISENGMKCLGDNLAKLRNLKHLIVNFQ